MSKYNIGDKVMVRLDLTRDTDPNLVVPEMTDLAGEVVTIDKIIKHHRKDLYCAEGGQGYYWSDECFVDLRSMPSLLDLIGGDKSEI